VGHNPCAMLCGTGFAPFFTRCPRAVQLNVGPFCKKRFERSYALTMKVSEVLSKLKDDGWELVATKGSHRQFKTKPGRVTVPGMPSDDLAPGTLNSIYKQAAWK